MGLSMRMSLGAITLLVVFCVASANAQQKIYWIDQGDFTINRADADGTGVTTLVTGQSAAVGLALDLTGGKMYWTNTNAGSIRRADLTGALVEDLLSGLLQPAAVAVDVVGGKIYWSAFARIQRANLADGSNIEDLFTIADGLFGPQGIAVDSAAGQVYWVDVATQKVQRGNTDGTGAPEDLVTVGLTLPVGIALDVADNRMYWVDQGGQFIKRARLDGSEIETIVSAAIIQPVSIALDLKSVVKKVYWAETGALKQIERANLDGTGRELVITSGLGIPQGIAVDAGCGNGIHTPGEEECDDGNVIDGDGCDSNCTITACGNGIATPGEACDDGNAVEGDGCDTNCSVSACGNGILAPAEFCDDGNTVNVDGCSSACLFEPFVFVDAAATGPTFDGSNWCGAFNNLQDALAVATAGDSVLIANGVYRPDQGLLETLGDRSSTFQLATGVTVQGGYAGCGFSGPHVPDAANLVILSADLNGDDSTGGDNSENAYHVVTGSGTDATAYLRGVTITGGNADGVALDNAGGGIHNDGGSPRIVRCAIVGNAAGRGGGVFNGNGSNPTFVNTTIDDNIADGAGGAGMRNENSGPLLINCTLTGNNTIAAGSGGAMFNSASTASLIHCTLAENSSAATIGGGIVANLSDATTLESCVAWGNGTLQLLGVLPTGIINYSCIEGGAGGVGNIASDPLFANAPGGDFTLQATSPCLDRADNTLVPADLADLDSDGNTAERTPIDLNESSRFIDALGAPDLGVPDPPDYVRITDMGAYELQMCDTVEDCCDLVPDGIRDDACLWCTCNGNCESTPLTLSADMGGPIGECTPDGFCNLADALHALTCFSNTSSCDSLNVDAGGPLGDCAPDGFCNLADALHALTCFAGTNPCTCGPSPQAPFQPFFAGEAELVAVPDRRAVRPGDDVQVRIFIAGDLDDLQSYQLHLGVSGGRRGYLSLVGITVEPRDDFVFAKSADDTFEAVNVDKAQMLGGLFTRGVPAKGQGYLATYTYRVSPDAAGVFVVDVLYDDANQDQTFVVSDFVNGIEISTTTPAVITVQNKRVATVR